MTPHSDNPDLITGKPSAYLPFYGNDFFGAVAGYSDTVLAGYLRALWHYWGHTHCKGLPDDDEYLRRVCCCDPADWPQVRAILFDNHYQFRLENGCWQQSRCRELWNKAVLAYRKKVKRTAAARAALAAAKSVTGSVTE